jgi:hypothetical protein
MISTTIERIVHTIAITSLLSLLAPIADAKSPLTANAREPAIDVVSADLSQANAHNGVYLFSSSAQSVLQDTAHNNTVPEAPEYMVLTL